MKLVHERYHKNTKSQNKIISPRNFTYIYLLPVLNKYLKPGMNILDIGCGAGTLSLYVASKNCNVTGIEISKRAIRSCLKSANKLGIKNINFIQAEFPRKRIDGKYDLVILSEVIEHLDDDQKALKDLNRLLKPNGILLLTTPSIHAPLHKIGLTKKFDERVGHLRRYDEKNLKKMLSEQGYKIIFSRIVEGPIRNILYINPVAGKLIRFIKFFLIDLMIFLDEISLKAFGGSDIIVVAKRS